MILDKYWLADVRGRVIHCWLVESTGAHRIEADGQARRPYRRCRRSTRLDCRGTSLATILRANFLDRQLQTPAAAGIAKHVSIQVERTLLPAIEIEAVWSACRPHCIGSLMSPIAKPLVAGKPSQDSQEIDLYPAHVPGCCVALVASRQKPRVIDATHQCQSVHARSPNRSPGHTVESSGGVRMSAGGPNRRCARPRALTAETVYTTRGSVDVPTRDPMGRRRSDVAMIVMSARPFFAHCLVAPRTQGWTCRSISYLSTPAVTCGQVEDIA